MQGDGGILKMQGDGAPCGTTDRAANAAGLPGDVDEKGVRCVVGRLRRRTMGVSGAYAAHILRQRDKERLGGYEWCGGARCRPSCGKESAGR